MGTTGDGQVTVSRQPPLPGPPGAVCFGGYRGEGSPVSEDRCWTETRDSRPQPPSSPAKTTLCREVQPRPRQGQSVREGRAYPRSSWGGPGGGAAPHQPPRLHPPRHPKTRGGGESRDPARPRPALPVTWRQVGRGWALRCTPLGAAHGHRLPTASPPGSSGAAAAAAARSHGGRRGRPGLTLSIPEAPPTSDSPCPRARPGRTVHRPSPFLRQRLGPASRRSSPHRDLGVTPSGLVWAWDTPLSRPPRLCPHPHDLPHHLALPTPIRWTRPEAPPLDDRPCPPPPHDLYGSAPRGGCSSPRSRAYPVPRPHPEVDPAPVYAPSHLAPPTLQDTPPID
ncbi:extensin-like [Trichosurus vulpecula]|uniref:extensin-like n=1 Tax=Trichosurus vulpecula TaxID=9337 RepID=UPI00186B1B19|nr:extensin-like [Trichosurus vulpecula]